MNVYFSGIGGVAIGPLSEIARDAGYEVQGSDTQASLITRRLEDRGIPVFTGRQDGYFLRDCHARKPIDLLVYTAALPKNHPELTLARKLGIPIAKRDELLAKIIKEKHLKLLAIAGTHGKTTTTGMLVWALRQLDIPISYSIGSTIGFGPSGAYDKNSRYFVYECDEFDRNFLHFSPYLSLVTSIDYDHPDTYPSESEYLWAFREFVSQSQMAIMWRHDSTRAKCPHASNWLLNDDEVIDVSLAGAHNRRNATLVIKALEYLGVADNQTARGILDLFPGTDRRFERLAEGLYSDYGHHPAEIAATLQLARELSDHVVVVYQPHQNIRQHDIKDEYKDVFKLAEKVYWLPTYLSREDTGLSILSPEELTAGISNRDIVSIAEMDDALWSEITNARKDGKLVVAMGAGSIDGWVRQQIAA